ncbi:MAG: ribose-phosphate pyrophosphokinase [Phycisphaerae bacterium]|nr:ribose-phosphate pyrophosphokinase [Phycisphaerae bacterium]
MTDEIRVLSGTAHKLLSQKICDYMGVPLGEVSIGRFPDGEISVKIEEDVRGRDVFVIQPTCYPQNDNLMELLLLIDSALRASAERVTAVIPYYGYARQDRKDEGRVPISAKLVANVITTAGANRILTMDLHANQIQGFFDIPVDHLYSEPVLADHYRTLGIADLTVVAPDAGGAKDARSYARRLGADMAIVDKERRNSLTVEAGTLIGTVKGRNVLIVDDMITSAGSMVAAADLLRTEGAKDIYAAVTHAVLCGEAVKRLKDSTIKRVTVTDTIPLSPEADKLEKLEVLSISQLLGEAIKRIHAHQSVSSLFS